MSPPVCSPVLLPGPIGAIALILGPRSLFVFFFIFKVVLSGPLFDFSWIPRSPPFALNTPGVVAPERIRVIVPKMTALA
jgi:hypothetical protein